MTAVCEHGRQRRKCEICELLEIEQENIQLRAEIERLQAILAPLGLIPLPQDILTQSQMIEQLQVENARLEGQLRWRKTSEELPEAGAKVEVVVVGTLQHLIVKHLIVRWSGPEDE